MTLSLISAPVAPGDTVTLTYTPPAQTALRDVAGNSARPLADRAVDNRAVSSTGTVVWITGLEPVNEGADARFTLTRTGSTEAALTVAVEVREEGAFLAGAPPDSVVFAPGDATAGLAVSTLDDDAGEDDGAIVATVRAGDDGYVIAAGAGVARVAVRDRGDPRMWLSLGGDVEVSESAGAAAVTVVARMQPGVSPFDAEAGIHTESDTAQHAQDYDHLSVTVAIGADAFVADANGRLVARVAREIVVHDNQPDFYEGDETFRVVLTRPPGLAASVRLGEPAAASVRITDDDHVPVITSSATLKAQAGGTGVAALTATDGDHADADLAWSIAGGADRAHFALTGAGVLSFVSAKSYAAPDDADSDRVYELQVRVTDGANPVTAALTVELVESLTAPGVPQGLTAQARSARVELRWTTPDDGGDALTGHRYRVSADGGTSWEPDWTDIADSAAGRPNARGVTVSGLANDTAYRFEVRAVNATGAGGAAAVTGTPRAATITALRIGGDAGADATYAIGDAIEATLTFTEPVTVDTMGGWPRLPVRIDPGGSRDMEYASGSESAELVFAYTVVEGDLDRNGIWIDRNVLDANGGTIRAGGADVELCPQSSQMGGQSAEALRRRGASGPRRRRRGGGRRYADDGVGRAARRVGCAAAGRLRGQGRGRGARCRADRGLGQHRDVDAGRGGEHARGSDAGLHRSRPWGRRERRARRGRQRRRYLRRRAGERSAAVHRRGRLRGGGERDRGGRHGGSGGSGRGRHGAVCARRRAGCRAVRARPADRRAELPRAPRLRGAGRSGEPEPRHRGGRQSLCGDGRGDRRRGRPRVERDAHDHGHRPQRQRSIGGPAGDRRRGGGGTGADRGSLRDLGPGRARGRGLHYQWTRRDDTTETDLAGETGRTYVPVEADAGNSLRVRVSFTDDGGFPEGPLVSEAVAVAGTVTLALSSDSIAEDGGAATVTATLSPAAAAPFSVTVSAAAVPPAVAGDFTLSENTTLSFAANETGAPAW